MREKELSRAINEHEPKKHVESEKVEEKDSGTNFWALTDAQPAQGETRAQSVRG
jgi:hypothetical protein